MSETHGKERRKGMKNQDTLYWLWLAERCGIASKKFNLLIEKYNDPFDLYSLEENEIYQLEGLDDDIKARLCRKDLDASYEILKYCKQNRVDIISYGDSRYPVRLKELRDPPIVLYCKGHFPDLNTRLCIGIVGTRRMTEYGRQSAYKIAYELGAADVITVSGMALGVDGACACGALSAGGATVAVLGCGIDTVYPKAHTALAAEIVRHGAIITEYPPKEAPRGYNFPKRNRIISGMCQGTLVVEAALGSGALITANSAIDQGREVFALPGKVGDANAEGPNELIRRGAYPVMSAQHILEHYEFLYGDVFDKKALTKAGKKIPDTDTAFLKYGLDYATGIKEEKDEVYLPPKGKRSRRAAEAEVKEREEREAAPALGGPQQETDKGSESSYNELIAGLDPTTRKILEALPQDRAVSADAAVGDGISVSDAITSLTLLELYGLVSSLPGGLYIRK